LKGWRDATVGQVGFYHYDVSAQILSKVARGFEKDLEDVRKMMASKDPGKLMDLFHAIRPDLVRFPAIDEKALSDKVGRFLDAVSVDPR
jgi:hypothetical protein